MAARFCSKCGQELASAAQFCPRCGTVVGNGPLVTRVEVATNTTRRLLIPAMVVALVVLVIVVGVLAKILNHSGALVTAAPSATAPVAPAITNAPSAPAPAAPAITNAPSQPAPVAPAVTNAPSKAAPSLPPEDARYLAFLQQIEQRRIALNNDSSGTTAMLQAAQGMQGGQDDPESHNAAVPSSVSKVSQGFAEYVTKCNDLARDFRAVNPPPDCSLIANSYLALLTDYAATISKLQVAVLNGDISAAMGSQGAQKQINNDGTQADQALSNLCTRFDVPKPFSIQVDGASSPLTGI